MVTHPFSFSSSYPLLVCVSLTGLKPKPHFHSGLWKGEKLWRLFGPLRLSPPPLFPPPHWPFWRCSVICVSPCLCTLFFSPILVTWTQALPASVLFFSGAPANRGCRSWLIAPCHLRIPTLAAIYKRFFLISPTLYEQYITLGSFFVTVDVHTFYNGKQKGLSVDRASF